MSTEITEPETQQAWNNVVRSVKRKNSVREATRLARREMLDELGFEWVDFGSLGDVCFKLALLTPEQHIAFDNELKRRTVEKWGTVVE